uniref:E3 ubiquitin-protein ligase n=1 Tax=Brassica oleracea var. oleracea TaxID=109376 RepID=A0A0D3B704_BRAOL
MNGTECDNGHLACSSCCPKLKNKCPSCALPVGHSRCRAMDTLLKSVFLPCQNAKYGCIETVAFEKEPTHEKNCTFAEYCCCPVRYCNYAGSYIDLYRHYVSSFHLYWQIFNEFCIGISCGIKMNISVQCFREPFGVYVTVSCIAPSIQEVGQFSYRLVYTVDGQTMTYKSSEMKKIREVSLQTPQDNYMLIPHSLLRGESLEMRLCIKMLNKE